MPPQRLTTALRLASAPAFEQIRNDRRAVPMAIGRVLEYLEPRLFDPDLSVAAMRRDLRIRDNAFSSDFRRLLGVTPRAYFERLRLETARRLLEQPGAEPGQVAAAVGYRSYRTFADAFRRWSGHSPTHLQGERSKAREAPRGTELAWVDGATHEQQWADQIWAEISDLPAEQQLARIRRFPFATSALFDLLRTQSRQRGRSDREQGIVLAELALESVRASSQLLGPRAHDLEALGWAWLGNARRLAFNFPGAEKDFRRAHTAWQVVRPAPDQLVYAEVLHLQGVLRCWQRRLEEALGLEDRAVAILERLDAGELLARALLGKANALNYLGEVEGARQGFSAVLALVPEGTNYLAMVASGNLALVDLGAGRLSAAKAHLDQAQSINRHLCVPLADFELKSIEAAYLRRCSRIGDAAYLLQEAGRGFQDLGAIGHAAVTHVALARTRAELGERRQALEILGDSVSTLISLGNVEEGLRAFQFLRQLSR